MNLEAILNRCADGLASDPDGELLAERLRSDPEARKAYREFMALHSALHWDYVAGAAPAPSPASGSGSRTRSLLLSRWTMFVAGAMLAAVASWTLLEINRHANHNDTAVKPSVGATEASPVAAVLVNAAGAAFADDRGPDGVQFGPGEYELNQGIVHVRFMNGADLILASPARLDIQDTQHARLVYGKVRVTAPPSAKGFTISTRAADYVDLGTEFGLQVDRESGACDLYVFDGQVNVADPRSGKTLSEVRDGQSSRFVDGAPGPAPDFTENDFPTTGAIGLQRWRLYEETMRQNPGLLAFYPFSGTDHDRVLKNITDTAGMENGRIVGARWTTGRWPGKEALLFDRDTDHVALEIPGTYRELSIAAWLKVDRLDFALTAILNSDGYDLGDIHFQLTRQGYPRGGVVVDGPFEEAILEQPVPLGEWVHVASIIDARTRSQRIYVNGILARERTWKSNELLRPGSCRLGNWLSVANVGPDRRAFRGRVDELAVWERGLTAAEILELVEAGRPVMVE